MKSLLWFAVAIALLLLGFTPLGIVSVPLGLIAFLWGAVVNHLEHTAKR